MGPSPPHPLPLYKPPPYHPWVVSATVLLLITLILCNIFIPWPGSWLFTVAAGDRRLIDPESYWLAQIGLQVSSQVSTYFFDAPPPLTHFDEWNATTSMSSSSDTFSFLRLDLHPGSFISLNYSITNASQCSDDETTQNPRFLVLRGSRSLEEFSSHPSACPHAIFSSSNYTGFFQFMIRARDEYYLVFHSSSGPADALLALQVRSLTYSLKTAIFTPLAGSFSMIPADGQILYLLLVPPLPDFNSSENNTFVVEYTRGARLVRYMFLYGPLIVGLVGCLVILVVEHVRKVQWKLRMQSDSETKPLLS